MNTHCPPQKTLFGSVISSFSPLDLFTEEEIDLSLRSGCENYGQQCMILYNAGSYNVPLFVIIH